MILTELFRGIVANIINLLETEYAKGNYQNCEEISSSVRDAYLAIKILYQFGPDAVTALPILMKLLEKEIHWWLPAIAALTIGKFGKKGEPAIPQLAHLLLSTEMAPKSAHGQFAATTALVGIGLDTVVPLLVNAAQDCNDHKLGAKAVHGLSQLGKTAQIALPELKILSKDKHYLCIWSAIDKAVRLIEQDIIKKSNQLH